jgi:hypothetical protein
LNGRSILVGVLGLAIGFAIVRDSFVTAYARSNPERAASVWPDHPRVMVSQALTDIGIAAVKRRPPPQVALNRIAQAGHLSPLGHDAFMVRGITAQQEGDFRLAEQAFTAARRRAPREAGPRYFLSELYIRSGREAEGLGELAMLARLLPNGPASVAPSLAAYARTARSLRELKALFRNHPELEQAVLLELAHDPANADLAVGLAGKTHLSDGSAPEWVRRLIPNLAEAGQFDRAYRLWSASGGSQSRGAIFDPGFRGSAALPPFNWTFRSDSAGFAEADGRGGLHVLFYGRDDAVLASQTLLLAPGSYRLTMAVAGNPVGMLRWTVTCLPAKQEIAVLPLVTGAGASPAVDFSVARGCAAQSLELHGDAGDVPTQADITVSALKLSGVDNAQ